MLFITPIYYLIYQLQHGSIYLFRCAKILLDMVFFSNSSYFFIAYIYSLPLLIKVRVCARAS